MSSSDRLALAALLLGFFSFAATILWPDKKWLGWSALAMTALVLLFWVWLELGPRALLAHEVHPITTRFFVFIVGGSITVSLWVLAIANRPAQTSSVAVPKLQTTAESTPSNEAQTHSEAPKPIHETRPQVAAKQPPKAHQEEIPYPWIAANQISLDVNKAVSAVRLTAYVRGWPTTKDDLVQAKLSIDSLFHLKISVWRVDAVGKNEQRGTSVMEINEPEWNNADASSKPSAWISLDRDVTVFAYRADARHSFWNGYLILRKTASNLAREEAMTGTVKSDTGESTTMAMTVLTAYAEGKPEMTMRDRYEALDSDRLKQLGVPEIKPTEQPQP